MTDETTRRAILDAALGPGIDYHWTGEPPHGLRLRAIDALLIPASALWLAFVLFWESAVIERGGGIFFVLWGVPFIVAGGYALVGRFFVDAYLRGATAYAIDGTSAYVVRGGRFPKVVAHDLYGGEPIAMTRRGDGSGTLRFGGSARTAREIWLGSSREFEAVPNVADVYALVRRLAADVRMGTTVRTR